MHTILLACFAFSASPASVAALANETVAEQPGDGYQRGAELTCVSRYIHDFCRLLVAVSWLLCHSLMSQGSQARGRLL